MGEARGADLAGRFAGDVLFVHEDFPVLDGAHACNGLEQLALAVALDGGDAEDLARTHGQRQAVHRRQAAVVLHGQVFHADLLRAGRAGLFQLVIEHGAADHHGGQHALIDVFRLLHADEFSLAHHADAVGDGHDLIELVRDKDDGHTALADDAPDDGEQLVRLLRGEHGGRLVEDQDFRAAVQRFQNFHALLQADARLGDDGVRVDRQAVFLHKAARFALGRALVEEQAEPARLTAHDDVLRHGKRRHEHEVLVHHADAVVDGVARAEAADLLTADGDAAARRGVDAVENVHQR